MEYKNLQCYVEENLDGVLSIINQNTITSNIIWVDKSEFHGFEYGDYILIARESNPHFQLAAQIRSKQLLINRNLANNEPVFVSRSLYRNLNLSKTEKNIILFNKNKFSFHEIDVIKEIEFILIPNELIFHHNSENKSERLPIHCSGLSEIFKDFLMNKIIVTVGELIEIDWFGSIRYLFTLSINGDYKIKFSGQNAPMKIQETTKIKFKKSFMKGIIKNYKENRYSQFHPVGLNKKYLIKSLKEYTEKLKSKFGGYEQVVEEICENVYQTIYPDLLYSPDVLENQPIQPTGNILITGIHGSGKSKLVDLLGKYSSAPTYYFHSSSLIHPSGIEDETVAAIKRGLAQIIEEKIGIVVIEGLENIFPNSANQENQSSLENHVSYIFKQFLDFLFEKKLRKKGKNYQIIIIATCFSINQIQEDYLRSGRFNKIYSIQLPNENDRISIFNHFLKSFKFPHKIDLSDEFLLNLTNQTKGFIGNDIFYLFTEYLFSEYLNFVENPKNQPETNSKPIFKLEEFNEKIFLSCLERIRPANLSEYLKNGPNNQIKFDDFRGIEEIKNQLKLNLISSFLFSEKYSKFNISTPRGFLFYGPPGTGKTKIANAVANESNLNFISIKSTELICPVVGESEKNIANLFSKVRCSAPCILFLDQIEILAMRRDHNDSNTSRERLLSCLLTEMDGIINHEREKIFILAATQNKEDLDAAILRPGRLDVHIHFPLPNHSQRVEILGKLLEKIPIEKDVDIEYLASNSENFSGADLENLCQEAAMCCLRDNINNSSVSKLNFDQALHQIDKQKGQSAIDTVNLQKQSTPILFNMNANTNNIVLNNFSFKF